MDPLESLGRTAVALAIGLLIGLDRERAEQRKSLPLYAGIRTFALIALAGALPLLLVEAAGIAPLVLSFVAVTAMTVVAYLRTSAEGHVGATTEIAAIVTFLLGALAGAGQLQVAAAVAIVVAVLLVAKPRLEAASRALSEAEMWAALELAVISAIVLPLLPDEGYGPWGALNPYEIWLVVVLVSVVSFAGFVAERVAGERIGMLSTAVLGALASSTAVTVAMAQRARADPSRPAAPAAAAVLASAVMCVRVGVLCSALGAGILPRLLPALGAMTLCALVAAGWIARRGRGERAAEPSSRARIASPLSLRTTLAFGAIYAATVLGIRAAQEALGGTGTLLVAALSSLVDVDAAAVAFARGGPGDSGWKLAATAVTVAMVTNTVAKLGIGLALGAGRFRRDLALGLGAVALAGVVTGVVMAL